MASSLAGCKTMHHYWPYHVRAHICVPGIVLRHLEILLPEIIMRHWDRLSRKTVLSSVLEKVFKKQVENCPSSTAYTWFAPARIRSFPALYS